jgi:predicted AAA+ superfamily ATPase
MLRKMTLFLRVFVPGAARREMEIGDAVPLPSDDAAVLFFLQTCQQIHNEKIKDNHQFLLAASWKCPPSLKEGIVFMIRLKKKHFSFCTQLHSRTPNHMLVKVRDAIARNPVLASAITTVVTAAATAAVAFGTASLARMGKFAISRVYVKVEAEGFSALSDVFDKFIYLTRKTYNVSDDRETPLMPDVGKLQRFRCTTEPHIFSGFVKRASVGHWVFYVRKKYVPTLNAFFTHYRTQMCGNVRISDDTPCFAPILAYIQTFMPSNTLEHTLTAPSGTMQLTVTCPKVNHHVMFTFPGSAVRGIMSMTAADDTSTERARKPSVMLITLEKRMNEPMAFLEAGLRAIVDADASNESGRDALRVFTWRASYNSGCWVPALTVSRRSLASVVLPAGVRERVVADLTAFLARRAVYDRRCIPYRRGVLLYGPPGTGKSSFIRGLAAHFRYSLCTLPVGSVESDASLASMVRAVPPCSFVVVEDIDRLFVFDKERGTWKPTTKMTMSGLLNVLDGACASQAGTIFFFTTNNLDELNPALIREGRMDMKIELGFAVREQVVDMFRHLFPDRGVKDADDFADAVFRRREPVTPAWVQEACLRDLDSDMLTLLTSVTVEANAKAPPETHPHPGKGSTGDSQWRVASVGVEAVAAAAEAVLANFEQEKSQETLVASLGRWNGVTEAEEEEFAFEMEFARRAQELKEEALVASLGR